MKILLLSLIGFSITTFNAGAGQLPDDLVQKLGATIRELCPDAQIEADNTVFTAKRDTMMFTLHSMDIHLVVYLSYPQNVSDDFLKRFTKLVNSFDKYVPADTGGKPAVQGLTLVIVSSWPAWEPARRESLANPSPASD